MEEFLEYQFPTDIFCEVVSSPGWEIDIKTGEGLFEDRSLQANDNRSLWRFEKTGTDIDVIKNLFLVARGRAIAFRFKDWHDYLAVLSDLGPSFSEDGCDFQLKKNYFSGSNYYSKDIRKPVSGTVEIFVNGIEETSGFSIDYTTGIVTFDVAPSSGDTIAATFEFDKEVRFNSDSLSFTVESQTIVYVSSELIEVLS